MIIVKTLLRYLSKEIFRRNFFISCLFFVFFCAHAQEGVAVKGYFLHDSTTLATPTPFVLVARYKQDKEVRFIDSTYLFGTWEWVKQRYFATRQEGKYHYDSVVYYLATYALDTQQYLRLPVYELTAHLDTIRYYTPVDTIQIRGLYGPLAEDIDLRPHLAYQSHRYPFDTARFLWWLGGCVVIFGVLFIVFRRRILRWWYLFKLRQRHTVFSRKMFEIEQSVSRHFTPALLEDGLRTWKEYIEVLRREPYKSLTTQEIVAKEKDLSPTLHAIDRLLYKTQAGDLSHSGVDLLIRLQEEGGRAYAVAKMRGKMRVK